MMTVARSRASCASKETVCPRASKSATLSGSTASLAPRWSRWLTLARSVVIGVRLWKVISSMPRCFLKSANSPISGSPMVPVPTTCTIFFMVSDLSPAGRRQRPRVVRMVPGAAREYDESGVYPSAPGAGIRRLLEAVTFPGPAGASRASGRRRPGRAGQRGLRPPASAPRRNASQQGRFPRDAGPHRPRDTGRSGSIFAAWDSPRAGRCRPRGGRRLPRSR